MPYAPRRTASTEIREKLDHPVIDCDGHLREFLPEWLDYMIKVGGQDWADRYLAKVGADIAESKPAGLGPNKDFASAALYTLEERRRGRLRRGPWWGMPVANPIDSASPYLPKLLAQRTEELGMDFLITYPTWGLTVHTIADDEDRLICTRAVNEMHSEVWNGDSDVAYRIHVPTVIPMHTPQEAIAELDHCVQTLGFRAIKIPAMVPRPVRALAEEFPGLADPTRRPDGVWADCYGLDSEYDYDPFWQRCTELGVAVTCHGAAAYGFPWKSRSISSWTFNHMGNQPWMQDMLAKTLYMGGVTARFPRLNFAFLEGGVGWACVLLNDIVQHWGMRSEEALELLNPTNLDRQAVDELMLEFGGDRFAGRLDKVVQLFPDPSEPIEPENYNDYRHTGAKTKEDLGPLFENFYFGCEADDKINAWAFNTKVNRFGMTLKAFFGSDIGHMDAPDFAHVVDETYELVDDGLLNEDEYRLFVADHSVLLHGRMNPDFFKGTAIEAYADDVLAKDTVWNRARPRDTVSGAMTTSPSAASAAASDWTIVSPDDHVFEPPNLWTDRLPNRYRGIGPRVELLPEAVRTTGPVGLTPDRPSTDGRLCAWWRYEDHWWMVRRMHAAAGLEAKDLGADGITYDDIRVGCYDPVARLVDMDANGVVASLCFPNYPRFAGQLFLNGSDKELALLCVQAYNDWMVEEWAGPSNGRLIPLCMCPLWDAELAAAEVRRNAARGVRAVTFSELPPWIGLPSIHSGHWDPFFQACEDTGTVICMHIGSGTKLVQSSADSPPAIQGTLIFANSSAGMLDYLHADVLVRYPTIKLFFAECQIGWIPYVLERADDVWETHQWSTAGSSVPKPSELYRDRVYSCFFKDAIGVEVIEHVGVNQTMFETDYPHADGTWPRSQQVAQESFRGVSPEVVEKVMRTNAINLFGLDRAQIGLG